MTNLMKTTHRYIHLCAYHPHSTITNFCALKQCLLPLCPSCIDIHNRQHANQNSTPEIFTLEESFVVLQEQVRVIEEIASKWMQKYRSVQSVVVNKMRQVARTARQRGERLMACLQKQLDESLQGLQLQIRKQLIQFQNKSISITNQLEQIRSSLSLYHRALHGTDSLHALINFNDHHRQKLLQDCRGLEIRLSELQGLKYQMNEGKFEKSIEQIKNSFRNCSLLKKTVLIS